MATILAVGVGDLTGTANYVGTVTRIGSIPVVTNSVIGVNPPVKIGIITATQFAGTVTPCPPGPEPLLVGQLWPRGQGV